MLEGVTPEQVTAGAGGTGLVIWLIKYLVGKAFTDLADTQKRFEIKLDTLTALVAHNSSEIAFIRGRMVRKYDMEGDDRSGHA